MNITPEFNPTVIENLLLRTMASNHNEPLTLHYLFGALSEYLILLSSPRCSCYADMEWEEALTCAATSYARRKALMQLYITYSNSPYMTFTLDEVMTKLHE